MKMILSLVILIGIQAAAQTTGILPNQKDAMGRSYTYIGELKNSKPNGMGIAKYPNGDIIRYVGSFVNGMFSGKGTMLFGDGSFFTGSWVSGKLQGRGVTLNSMGTLYVGEFKNGMKDGQGFLIFKDNSFVKGSFINDMQSGRCINVWKDGNIVSDVIYSNDKRNGTGYQYESATKKLYEGQWTDDKWVQATRAGFSSFLQTSDFIGETTSEHVLMGPTGSGGLLKDTSYYYDLKKNKRYFGYYERGRLKNGIIVSDSTRFIGQLNEDGATGYCYDFKFDRYFSEGIYQKDFLNGGILDISLDKKAVYYGEAKEGYFTGKAYYFSNSNTMYCGDYLEGKFTGQGYRLDSRGKCVKGTFDDGEVKKVISITTGEGKVISGTPKTFAEALNLVVEDYYTIYEVLTGDMDDSESDLPGLEDEYLYFSLIAMPGSIDRDRIALDFADNNFYASRFIETSDFSRAKAKYDEIGRLLKSVIIRNSQVRTGKKLEGQIVAAVQGEKTESSLKLTDTPPGYEKFRIWLDLIKTFDGQYTVIVKVGEQKDGR